MPELPSGEITQRGDVAHRHRATDHILANLSIGLTPISLAIPDLSVLLSEFEAEAELLNQDHKFVGIYTPDLNHTLQSDN